MPAVLTSYSPENVLRSRLVALNLSVDVFAALVRVNQTRMSRGMRGLTPFHSAEAQRFLKLTEELQQLAHAVEPFPLPQDPRILEPLLSEFRARREYWGRLEAELSSLRERVIDDVGVQRLNGVGERI